MYYVYFNVFMSLSSHLPCAIHDVFSRTQALSIVLYVRLISTLSRHRLFACEAGKWGSAHISALSFFYNMEHPISFCNSSHDSLSMSMGRWPLLHSAGMIYRNGTLWMVTILCSNTVTSWSNFIPIRIVTSKLNQEVVAKIVYSYFLLFCHDKFVSFWLLTFKASFPCGLNS